MESGRAGIDDVHFAHVGPAYANLVHVRPGRRKSDRVSFEQGELDHIECEQAGLGCQNAGIHNL